MPEKNDIEFPKHFDGRRFFNPGGSHLNGLGSVIRWKLTTRPEREAAFFDDVMPCVPPAQVDGERMRITFVNHSTVLLQHRDVHILTDPIWSLRCSPVQWAGPKRKRNPGVHFEDLPRIDIVLLSHNHYDHLDLATLGRIQQRGTAKFVVPVGVARLLERNSVGPGHELDWGHSVEIGAAKIHAVPAVHFSSRSARDRNQTLWCGYIIECAKKTVYFAGDTAFGSHYAEIRARFGAPDLALLPVGAYLPRWFMSPVHQDPAEALRAHEILGARTTIAIHHGTFQLADERIDAPRRELASRPESFVFLANGEWKEVAW